MEPKENKSDSDKTNASLVNESISVGPSEQIMVSKFSTSSSDVASRQESKTDSIENIKTGHDSEMRLKQQSSEVQTKSSEWSFTPARDSSGSIEQIKRDTTVMFMKKDSDGHVVSIISSNVSKRAPERTKSSVVKVEPGAPPPVRLEPGAQLTIRQPFKLLMDIWGVLTSYTFRNDLFAYIDEHLKPYIVAHLDEYNTKDYVNDLASRTAEDLAKGMWPTMPSVPMVPEETPESNQVISYSEKEVIAEAVVRNLTFRKATKDKSLMKGLDVIYSQIWNDGYREKTLRPHLFSDVMRNLRKWHAEPLFIKMYTFASGPPEIQKLFLSATIEGDVTEYLTYFFDTRHTYKYDSNRYRQVISGLSERDPKNLFYLTDSPKKGREACKAGLTVFIVRREGNKQYKQKYLDKFTVIDSLDQFDFFEFQ